MPNAFLQQFPIATTDFVSTIRPIIGQNYPKDKYAKPTQAISDNIKSLIITLHAYDDDQTTDLLQNLNDLMAKLELTGIRLLENNDALIFKPNAASTPIVCGGVLVWNFAIASQLFIYDPHPGQEISYNVVTSQFLNGAKALLSHAFNPNVAINPNFKGNPITSTNIKKFTDPSHSDTTAFVPFIQQIVQTYPASVSTVNHTMLGQPDKQIFATNDHSNHFLMDGTRSWNMLLMIALALQPLPTNPNIILISASLPGFITDPLTGLKAPLSSPDNPNSPIRTQSNVGNNTDTCGHLANGSIAAFSRGMQTDRSMFIEFGPSFKVKNALLMPLFLRAQAMALDWYNNYDEDIHDPWKLDTRYPNVYNDMRLYPKLYDMECILATKPGTA